MKLVLASTSPYRKQLLAKLKTPFECCSPNIPETASLGEFAPDLALRLAKEKAAEVARLIPDALIIGSDQVASLDGIILTKPGNRENAIEQLEHCSNRSVIFYTGLALQNTATGSIQSCIEPFEVKFRPLSKSDITHYLDLEEPYDCAGSFKAEGMGIVLFEYLRGEDPNSLIGLPLIRLVTMLKQEGVDVL